MFKLFRKFLELGIKSFEESIKSSTISIKAHEDHIDVGKATKDFLALQSRRMEIETEISRKSSLISSMELVRLREHLKGLIEALENKKKLGIQDQKDLEEYKAILRMSE